MKVHLALALIFVFSATIGFAEQKKKARVRQSELERNRASFSAGTIFGGLLPSPKATTTINPEGELPPPPVFPNPPELLGAPAAE